MMIKKRNILCIALLTVALLQSQVMLAGNRAGTVTAQFLKLPTNARATAMGNAQVALSQGALSIGSNPAGILSTVQYSVGATYNEWFADITHSFMGISANIEGIGTIGGGLTILTTDDMAVTTPGLPEGTGELFKATDYAFTLTYGRQISEEFGLGLSAKYIKSYLYNDEISSNSIAFDIGSLYDIPALRTRLGITVTNLGRDLTYLNEQYSLPTSLKFGALTTIIKDEETGLYATAQIGRPNDADEQYNLGIEYVFRNVLSLRSGYRFNYDTEDWSAGLGMNLSPLGAVGSFDYAYTHYKFLPGTHMFSLELGF